MIRCGRSYAIDAVLLLIFIALVSIYLMKRQGYVYDTQPLTNQQTNNNKVVQAPNSMDVVDTRINKITDVRSASCKTATPVKDVKVCKLNKFDTRK